MVDEATNAATTGIPTLAAPPAPACTDSVTSENTRCTFAIASSKGLCLAASFVEDGTFTPNAATPSYPGSL